MTENQLGAESLGKEGLLKKVVLVTGLQPDMIKMAGANKDRGITTSPGVILHVFRATAGKKTGHHYARWSKDIC